MNIKAHFSWECNVTSAMTLLPFIMVPVKCPNLRNCAVFDIVKKYNFQFNMKSLHVLFETIRHLRYCTGVEQVNSDEENLPPFFKEHVSSNIKAHFSWECNVTSAMTLLPFIMVPVKCPSLRNCAVFDIVKKSGGTTEIRLLKNSEKGKN
jgi:hypothetical protein